MKIVTSGEMRDIDRISINDFGIPSLLLMGLAGRGAADKIMSHYPRATPVAAVCGTGNNGGDGFAAAYYLANLGAEVKIFIAGDGAKIFGDPLVYKKICEKFEIPIETITDPGSFNFSCALIVDAVFGTGFRGNVNPFCEKLFAMMNSHPAPIVSIDIPSGLPSEGDIYSPCCVTADMTITIGLPKISISTYPGKKFAGIVNVIDIGFPRSLTDSETLRVSELDRTLVKKILSKLEDDPDTHKYARGHLLIAGGFDGMEGAALIAAKAALETGIGLVTIITTETARKSIAGLVPEAMTAGLNEIILKDPERLTDYLINYISTKKITAAVIGPGLGRDICAENLYCACVRAATGASVKVILDGDALFFMANKNFAFPDGGPSKILATPHIMEAAHLLDTNKNQISTARLSSAQKIAEKYLCSVLLKGPAAIITDAEQTFVNQTGSSNLAIAGSGDALSGIAGALLCRLPALESGAAAAYIHGLAGDILLAEGNPSIKTGDIVNTIKKAVAETISR